MDFEKLSNQYVKTKESKILIALYVESLRLTNKHITLRYKRILPNDFKIEIALEYISYLKTITKKTTKTYENVIRELCKKHIKNHISANVINNLSNKLYYIPNVYNRIEVDEIINEYLSNRVKIDSILLYVAFFGNINILTEARNFLEEKEYIILCQKVIEMENKLNSRQFDLNMYVPKTPLGRTILLSLLMSKNPQMTQLLLLLGDFKKFIQFTMLNEGKTFTVPKTTDLVGDLIELSKTTDRIENDKSTINDLDLFKGLVLKNEDQSTEIFENLTEYMSNIFSESLSNYKKMSEDLLKKFKNANYKEKTEIYKIFTEELETHKKMHESMTMLSSDVISNILNRIDD